MTSIPAVDQLIPHRGTMVFLEKVVEWDSRRLVACCVVRESHGLLLGLTEVDAMCGLEYIGQAAAAFMALNSSARSVAEFGYLASMRRTSFFVDRLSVGARLVVEVCLDDMSGHFAQFDGAIRDHEGKDLVTGRFGVYSPNSTPA